MIASDTGLEALGRAIRYQRLMSTGAQFELVHDGGQAALRLSHQAFLNVRDVLEPYFFAMIWRWLKMAAPPSMTPVAIHLTVPQPDNDCFSSALASPISWNGDHAAMIFEEAALRQPWQMRNPEIVRANQPMLDNLLRALKSGDVAATVRMRLLDALDTGLPSEEDIANSLHMSARTLQRRLKAENTTYGEVVQQTRLQLAQQLLASTDISATEVGLACGFGDASAFTRAFRRWTGTTPSDYRNNPATTADLDQEMH
jgi:AraC-like DNA-binding protein